MPSTKWGIAQVCGGYGSRSGVVEGVLCGENTG